MWQLKGHAEAVRILCQHGGQEPGIDNGTTPQFRCTIQVLDQAMTQVEGLLEAGADPVKADEAASNLLQ